MHRLFGVLVDEADVLDSRQLRDKARRQTKTQQSHIYDYRSVDDIGRYNNTEPYCKYEDQNYVVYGTDEDFMDILEELAVEEKHKDIDNYLENAVHKIDDGNLKDPDYLKKAVIDEETNRDLYWYFKLLQEVIGVGCSDDNFYSNIQHTYRLTRWDREYIANNKEKVALVLFDYHF